MSKFDPERETHKAWLGLLQPVGLVVAPPALIKAQAVLDKNATEFQQGLLSIVERPASLEGEPDPELRDFPAFATEVLGWAQGDLAGAPGGPLLPESLEVVLPEYGETLRPTFCALDGMANGQVLLLISITEQGVDLDASPDEAGRGWHASPQARLERLLRDTKVPAGLLCNGRELRLVYAPGGESSGHVGFPIAEMCTVGGRLILAALHMLLSEHRVFSAPDGQRLLDILAESRKYQTEVSTKLAEQVLGALWELLRGFQAADEAANGQVLHDLTRTAPDQIYGGTLTVIMRLVFLLYAEEQGLMEDDPVYVHHYSITGLYTRLREDAGRYPDTMDQRYGAWSWLLSTFRLVFDGGSHADLSLPTRHGQLFNPDEYPFLEGRAPGVPRVMGATFDAPKVSDGVIWRVLEGLLMLDGERLSYRALDVEQIGSVYEAMMGFDVQTTSGRSIAVKPKRIVIDLDELLKQPSGKRAEWLKKQGECELNGKGADALKQAKSVDDLVVALGRRVTLQTPHPLPPGALFLQPGEERRRSGSHYTPRELTEPIVRTTLTPVLEALGERPTPEQILTLKVCDPAMGSGAFLVEACRQLAQALVGAWEAHQSTPPIPPDEYPELHARRLVAQRCLYGVDKNPFAVNLAKLSLWLVTLARDHAFTFLDHALKHGDSLVGLTKKQIGAFHWNPPDQGWEDLPLLKNVSISITKASSWRERLQLLDDGAYEERREAWREAEEELRDTRFIGDLCVAAFFGADKDKDRERARSNFALRLNEWRAGRMSLNSLHGVVEHLHSNEHPVIPFHWEIEFPEVFGRTNPGFDAMVGNPPFMGGSKVSGALGGQYLAWLLCIHERAHGNADLVSHFFRRAFECSRDQGTFGLVATNTIAQGDTRSTGLRWICTHGGEIYSATSRRRWPGQAAVIVSTVHLRRGTVSSRELNGQVVGTITAYLFHSGGNEDPFALAANAGRSFKGVLPSGRGFSFDDSNVHKGSWPISEMDRVLLSDKRNAQRIRPYMVGEDLNESPTLSPCRFIIDLNGLDELGAQTWPDLLELVRVSVKVARDGGRLRDQAWWRFERARPQLAAATSTLERVIVCCQTSKHRCFAFAPASIVFDQKLVVLALDDFSSFAVVESRVHEVWALFFGSTMKDDPVYTPSDCFETFPFPVDWRSNLALEESGRAYCDFRAGLMIRNNEGLTESYNRVHDPNERSPDIADLRKLHAAMDRAVLDAYGWQDIPVACDFLLDYEVDQGTSGRKKKPYRYRWPDSVRDEVLARLLVLNRTRHENEVATGVHGNLGKGGAQKSGAAGRSAQGAGKKASKERTPRKGPVSLSLFGNPEDDA